MWFLYLLLMLVGFVLLYYGAEWLVDGASDIATHMRWSKSFIGLTLVAFGTSAPEMVVNVVSAFWGGTNASPFAMANVAGSNLTNLCVGFGLSTLFCTLPAQRGKFLIDFAFVFLTPCLVLTSFFLAGGAVLSYYWAWVFVGLLCLYLTLVAMRRRAAEAMDPSEMTLGRPLRLFVYGAVALYLGGEIVYRTAMVLATSWAVPQPLIGLTIVACGTSIPDVTASVVAARKGEYEISVGNILGSNISNILVVLSATCLVTNASLVGTSPLMYDYIAVACVSALFFFAAVGFQRVGPALGVSALIAFVAYYGWRIFLVVANAVSG